MASRLAVSPFSEHQASVIEAWAALEERSTSNLCAYLIDLGLKQAASTACMPVPVIDYYLFRNKDVLQFINPSQAEVEDEN